MAIDRTSKFAFVELHRKALRKTAADFLRHLVEAVPYKINIVLTEPSLVRHWFKPNGGGTHFTTPGAGGSAAALIAEALAKGEPVWAHAFEYACATLGIQHRTTKPKHPWSHEDQKTIRGIVFLNGGQVERMNRTIKDATVKRFPYDDHDQLRSHLADFLSAYNFGRRLKTLKGLTPDEFICKCWTSQPERFTLNPLHQMPGLNS